jgi:hypothetical protein
MQMQMQMQIVAISAKLAKTRGRSCMRRKKQSRMLEVWMRKLLDTNCRISYMIAIFVMFRILNVLEKVPRRRKFNENVFARTMLPGFVKQNR